MSITMDVDSICKELTHCELVEITNSTLCTILATDSLLGDIPPDITLEEVISKIAVEHGQSITLTLLRDHEAPLNIIVPQKGTTVINLKKAIRRHYEIHQKRTKSSKIKISWKYIWRTYNLEYDGITLEDDCSLISDYGVSNKCEIKFVKKFNKNRCR